VLYLAIVRQTEFFNCLFIICCVFIAVFLTACESKPTSVGNQPPTITQLAAEHTVLYPLGNTRIECLAYDSDSDLLSYKWVSNDGLIVGNGSSVTWEAPRSYGDYHIMVSVDDGYGHSISKVVTVSVIVREAQKYCSSCPK
jgi:hypothetical protein